MCSYFERVRPNQIKKGSNVVKDNYNGIPFQEEHLIFSSNGL